MTHLANIRNTLATLTALENLRRSYGATYLFRSYVEDEKGRDLGTNSIEVKRRDGSPLTEDEVAMLKDCCRASPGPDSGQYHPAR